MAQVQNMSFPVIHDEQAFFKALGARIAGLRKDRGLTQAQLGEALGVSQQTINSFEKGRRRVPVSALPTLTQVLGVSTGELLGEEQTPAKRGPTARLQQQLEQLRHLPRTKQRFVIQMLDTVLQQAG